MHISIPSTPPTSQPPDGWNCHRCVSVWAVVPTICRAFELDCSALSGDRRQLDEMHNLVLTQLSPRRFNLFPLQKKFMKLYLILVYLY
jgi:hypothetical protein